MVIARTGIPTRNLSISRIQCLHHLITTPPGYALTSDNLPHRPRVTYIPFLSSVLSGKKQRSLPHQVWLFDDETCDTLKPQWGVLMTESQHESQHVSQHFQLK